MELSGEDAEPRRGRLELAYAAPDRGAVRMQAGEHRFEIHLGPGGIHALLPDEDGALRWRKGTFRDPAEAGPWRSLLDERFPPTRPDAGHGLTFDLKWNGMRGVEGFAIDAHLVLNRRRCVLGWLGRMQRQADEMSVEGDTLTWAGDGFRCALSLETGFPVRLEARTREGEVKLELAELLVDAAVELEPLEPPPEARAAPESPELAWTDPSGPHMGRVLVFFRVSSLLAHDERTWNDTVRADFEAVLAEVHGELVATRYQSWMEELRAGWERLRGDLEERSREGSAPDRAELAESFRRTREELVRVLDEAEGSYVGSIPQTFGSLGEAAPPPQLFEAEREAARAAHEQRIQAPLLAELDALTARALGD